MTDLSGFDAEIAKQGVDKELQAQFDAQVALKQTFDSIDFAAGEASALMTTAVAEVEKVTENVEAGDLCNTKFSPNVMSAASLFLSAITNPTGAALSGLQLLMNETGLKPPGLGLPPIDIDLGLDLDLPDLKLPSFDLKLDTGGGFSISSLMDSVGGLLQIPPLSGCDTFLPDIGPGAPKIAGALPAGLEQGVSGGVSNITAKLGNQKIKTEFDIDGNEIKKVVTEGANAIIPRIPSRYPPPASRMATFDYPAYKGPGLQSNDESVPPSFREFEEYIDQSGIFNLIPGGSFKELIEAEEKRKAEEEAKNTPEAKGARLFGAMQSGTGKNSTVTTGKVGGDDPRSREGAKKTGADVFRA